MIAALPGEYLFADRLTGKWGYVEKGDPLAEKVFIAREISQTEIENLFSAILWIDDYSFKPQTSDKNLYERLFLNIIPIDAYRTIGAIGEDYLSDGFLKKGGFISYFQLSFDDINGAYLAKIPAQYSRLWSLILISLYILIFTIIWNLLGKFRYLKFKRRK